MCGCMTFGPAEWQVLSNLSHPSLGQLLEDLKRVLDDDAHTSKHTFINRTQQWYGLCHSTQHIDYLKALDDIECVLAVHGRIS